MTPQLKHRLAVTGKVLLVILSIVVVLGISGFLYIRTDSGREFVRTKMNTVLSDQINGDFELRHLDEIAFNRVVGRDLIIMAPDGEKVIELRNIVLKPVWSKLLTGHINSSEATVKGGIFRIREYDDTLSIIQAVKSPPKPPGEKGGKPIRIHIENIDAQDIEVLVTSKKMPELHFKNIAGQLEFETLGRVIVTLDKTRGDVDFPILGETKLRQLSGKILSKRMDVIDFQMNMELGDMVPTHFMYRVPKNEKKPGDPKMVIRFSKEKSPSFFPKLVLNMADALTDFIDVGFEDTKKP